MDLDLVIRGGHVVTADSSFTGDIGIKGEKITRLAERLDNTGAAREIDASGLIVAPGAIDVHTHFPTIVG